MASDTSIPLAVGTAFQMYTSGIPKRSDHAGILPVDDPRYRKYQSFLTAFDRARVNPAPTHTTMYPSGTVPMPVRSGLTDIAVLKQCGANAALDWSWIEKVTETAPNTSVRKLVEYGSARDAMAGMTKAVDTYEKDTTEFLKFLTMYHNNRNVVAGAFVFSRTELPPVVPVWDVKITCDSIDIPEDIRVWRDTSREYTSRRVVCIAKTAVHTILGDLTTPDMATTIAAATTKLGGSDGAAIFSVGMKLHGRYEVAIINAQFVGVGIKTGDDDDAAATVLPSLTSMRLMRSLARVGTTTTPGPILEPLIRDAVYTASAALPVTPETTVLRNMLRAKRDEAVTNAAGATVEHYEQLHGRTPELDAIKNSMHVMSAQYLTESAAELQQIVAARTAADTELSRTARRGGWLAAQRKIGPRLGALENSRATEIAKGQQEVDRLKENIEQQKNAYLSAVDKITLTRNNGVDRVRNLKVRHMRDLGTARDDLRTAEENVGKLTADSTAAAAKFARVEAKLKDAEKTLSLDTAASRATRAALELELTAVTAELDTATDKTTRVGLVVTRLESELARVKTELAVAETGVLDGTAASQAAVAGLEAELARLAGERTVSHARVAGLEVDLAGLEADLAGVKNRLGVAEAGLAGETAASGAAVTALRVELAEAKANLITAGAVHGATILDLKRELDTASASVAASGVTMDDLTRAHADAITDAGTENKEELAALRRTHRHEMRNAKEEAATSKAGVDTATSNLNAAKQKVSRLETRLEEANAKVTELNIEASENAAQMAGLRTTNMANEVFRGSENDKLIADHNAEITDLKRRISALTGENAVLTAEQTRSLAEFDSKITELTTRHAADVAGLGQVHADKFRELDAKRSELADRHAMELRGRDANVLELKARYTDELTRLHTEAERVAQDHVDEMNRVLANHQVGIDRVTALGVKEIELTDGILRTLRASNDNLLLERENANFAAERADTSSEIANRQFLELVEEKARENAQFSSEINETRATITRLSAEHESDVTRLDKLQSMLTAKTTELKELVNVGVATQSAEIRSLRDEIRTATAASAKLEGVVAAKDGEITKLTEKLVEIRTEFTAESMAADERHKSKLDKLYRVAAKANTDHTAAITKLKAKTVKLGNQAASNNADAAQKLGEEMAKMRIEHIGELEAAGVDYTRRLALATAKSGKIVAELEGVHAAELAASETAHTTMIDNLRNDALAERDAVTARLKTEHQALIAANDANIAQLIDKHTEDLVGQSARRFSQLAVDHENELEAVRVEYVKKLAATTSESEVIIANLKVKHAADLAAAETVHNAAITELKANANGKFKTRLAAEKTKLNNEHGELIEIKNVEINELTAAHAADVHRLAEQLAASAGTLQEFRREFAAVKTSHDLDVAEIHRDQDVRMGEYMKETDERIEITQIAMDELLEQQERRFEYNLVQLEADGVDVSGYSDIVDGIQYADVTGSDAEYHDPFEPRPINMGKAEASLYFGTAFLSGLGVYYTTATAAAATGAAAAAAAAAGGAGGAAVVPAMSTAVAVMAPVAAAGAVAAVVVPSAAVVIAAMSNGMTYDNLIEVAKKYAVNLLGSGMITRRQLSLATADTIETFGVALMMLSLGLNDTAVASTDLKGFTGALTPVINGLANDIRVAAVPGWNSVDDRSWARLNADQVALYIIHMTGGTSLFKAMTTPNRQQLLDEAGGEIASVMMKVVDLRQCAANETGYVDNGVKFDSVPSWDKPVPAAGDMTSYASDVVTATVGIGAISALFAATVRDMRSTGNPIVWGQNHRARAQAMPQSYVAGSNAYATSSSSQLHFT